MKVTVAIEHADSADESVIVAEFERSDSVNAASLGLSLTEAKGLLSEVQRTLVRAQISAHAAAQRTCCRCGGRRHLKDHRRVSFKSLFGVVVLTIPRLLGCPCDPHPLRARTLGVEGLVNWVAPELEYAQSRLAADMS